MKRYERRMKQLLRRNRQLKGQLVVTRDVMEAVFKNNKPGQIVAMPRSLAVQLYNGVDHTIENIPR